MIAVEIDFEAMAPVRDGVITINTPARSRHDAH